MCCFSSVSPGSSDKKTKSCLKSPPWLQRHASLGLSAASGLSVNGHWGGDPRAGTGLPGTPRSPGSFHTGCWRALRWCRIPLTLTAEQIMRKMICKHPRELGLILLQLCSHIRYWIIRDVSGKRLLSVLSQDHKVDRNQQQFSGKKITMHRIIINSKQVC